MFRSSRIATVLFAATGAALISATPALASDDNNTQQFTEGGIQAANNHAHTVCICPVPLTGGQQIAVVPALANYKGNHRNNLTIDGGAVDRLVSNGNLVEHS